MANKEFDFIRVGNEDIYVPKYDDSGVKATITKETEDRKADASALSDKLNTEINNRKNSDDSLNTAIKKEVSDRTEAIASTDSNLSALRQEFNSTRVAKKIVLIGDSYNEGYTPDGSVTGWGDKLKSLMPYCTFYNYYSGGAGFSHVSASTGKKFIDLLNQAGSELSEAERNNISLVLIGGGFNDRSETKADLKTAIDAFANRCRQLFPYAECTFAQIGFSADSQERNRIRTLSSNLRDCRTSGMRILTNTCFTLHDYSYFSSDGIHPNNAGEDALAQTLSGVILGSDPTIIIGYDLYSFSDSELVNTASASVDTTKNYLDLRSTFSEGNTHVQMEGRFRGRITNTPLTIATYPKNLKIGEGWTTPALTDFMCELFGRDSTGNYFNFTGFVRFAEDWKIQVYHKEVDSSADNRFKTIDCSTSTSYCNILLPMSVASGFDL